MALDNMEVNGALFVAERLSGMCWGFKINDLLLEAGVSVIPKLRRFGKVFCDPKLEDIPYTVTNCVKKLSRAGANLISVDASGNGGKDRLQAALSAIGNSDACGIAGTTVLTSEKSFAERDFFHAAFTIVLVKADAVICSAADLKLLNRYPGYRRVLKITPGIRPSWWRNDADDQKRVATPEEAVWAGSDYLVIGRPITESPDPKESLRKIRQNIADFLASKEQEQCLYEP